MKNTQMEQEKNGLLTKRQLASYIQLTPRTVDRLMARGLPHYKIGNQRARFRISEIHQWMEENCRVVRNA